MGFSRQEYWSGCMPSFRGSSQTRDQTQFSCIAGGFFTFWATREPTVPCFDCCWSCWGYRWFLSSLYFCVCLNKCPKKLLGNLKNNLGAFKAFPVISQSVRSHKRKDWDSPLDRNFFKEKNKTEWQKKKSPWINQKVKNYEKKFT